MYIHKLYIKTIKRISDITFMTTHCEGKSGNNALLYTELENLKVLDIKKNIQSLLLQADKIDLKLIKARTMRVFNWSEERADSVIQEYRKMLVMAKLGVRVVPGKDIDEIWHSHILFTINYQDDCKNFFGYYFHHNPSEGSSEEEKIKHRIIYRNMIIFYKNYFCQEMYSPWNLNNGDNNEKIESCTADCLNSSDCMN
jgi:hypothetical protein